MGKKKKLQSAKHYAPVLGWNFRVKYYLKKRMKNLINIGNYISIYTIKGNYILILYTYFTQNLRLTDGAIRSVCFSQTGVIAHVTSSADLRQMIN
jgi:hypothetical protein